MSLQDFIVEQPLILISLALALAPLVVALVALLISRLRQRRTQQARRHLLQAMTSPQEAAIVSSEQAFQERAATPLRRKQQGQPGSAQTELAEVEAEASPEGEEEPHEEHQNPTEKVSSAMQALLSDVFRDDEALSRYEVLLSGLDEIAAAELALRCEQVATQLRAGRVPAA